MHSRIIPMDGFLPLSPSHTTTCDRLHPLCDHFEPRNLPCDLSHDHRPPGDHFFHKVFSATAAISFRLKLPKGGRRPLRNTLRLPLFPPFLLLVASTGGKGGLVNRALAYYCTWVQLACALKFCSSSSLQVSHKLTNYENCYCKEK